MRAADAGNLVAIGVLGGVTYRMHENDAPKLLPWLLGAQHRQERSDACARRNAPQGFGFGKLGNREEAIGLRQHPDRVAAIERRETRR